MCRVLLSGRRCGPCMLALSRQRGFAVTLTVVDWCKLRDTEEQRASGKAHVRCGRMGGTSEVGGENLTQMRSK